MTQKMPAEYTEGVTNNAPSRRQQKCHPVSPEVGVNDQYSNYSFGRTQRLPVQRMENTISNGMNLLNQNICEETYDAGYSFGGQQSFGTGATAIAGLSTTPALNDQGQPVSLHNYNTFAQQGMGRGISRSASHLNFGHSNPSYKAYRGTQDSPSQVVPDSPPFQSRDQTPSFFFGDTPAAVPSTPGDSVTPRASNFPTQFQQHQQSMPYNGSALSHQSNLEKEAASKSLQPHVVQGGKSRDRQVLNWFNENLGNVDAELSEENVLGYGGQGIVYKVDGMGDREIVVKVLNEDCKILEIFF